MDKEYLINIAKMFKIDGKIIDVNECSSGHINKTYVVECRTSDGKSKKYILQYVNTDVFPNLPELMNNMKKVTEYIISKARKNKEDTKRLTIKIIGTNKNTLNDIYNKNWRMEEFIDNTTTYLTTENLDVLFEAGKAVGKFQKYLDGFPAEELYEVIPKFHYTPNRVNQLKEALSNKENLNTRNDRFKLAKETIEFLTEERRINKTNIITEKLQNGIIPLRVTHNDTKLSNILFDKDTNKSVCLIDLDTVMPGSLVYDFGESLRTGITTAEEDESDLSKVRIDMKRFESYTKGFLNETKDIITKEEIKLLPLGVWMMTYENAIRFLADYLNGDVYFGVDENIKNHNLIRAKVHVELLKQMEEQEDEMIRIIENISEKNI